MIDQLKQQIEVVVASRQKVAEFKGVRDALLAEWNREHQSLLDSLTQAGAELAESEARLRELTLLAYEQTGDKAPVLGVGVREVTRLEYDGKAAFDWAVEHRVALKLDVAVFEKLVKVQPLEFVVVRKEPQATIATELKVVD